MRRAERSAGGRHSRSQRLGSGPSCCHRVQSLRRTSSTATSSPASARLPARLARRRCHADGVHGGPDTPRDALVFALTMAPPSPVAQVADPSAHGAYLAMSSDANEGAHQADAKADAQVRREHHASRGGVVVPQKGRAWPCRGTSFGCRHWRVQRFLDGRCSAARASPVVRLC